MFMSIDMDNTGSIKKDQFEKFLWEGDKIPIHMLEDYDIVGMHHDDATHDACTLLHLMGKGCTDVENML